MHTPDPSDHVPPYRYPRTGAHVEKTADQSISADTTTKVTWDQERYDDEDEFDLPNDKFVAGKDGKYRIYINLYWIDVADQDYVGVRLYLNGSSVKGNNNVASGTTALGVTVQATLELSEGDTIEVYGRTGGANTVLGNSDYTFAEFIYLGPC